MSRRNKVNNLATVPGDCKKMGDIIHPGVCKNCSYDPYQHLELFKKKLIHCNLDTGDNLIKK